MARPSAPIIINPSDKHELELVLRSKKVESRIKERARIIMLWYEGKNYDETTTICNVHREAIALWRKRFNEFGFKGLEDAPRSGAPTKIKESQKNKVIKLACSKPKGGYSNWSQKRIGKETGMSQSKVHKILKEHDLKVEIWFNILSKDVLKGAVWHSKRQLTDQLMEYIKTYNKERAKPFQWTYQPD